MTSSDTVTLFIAVGAGLMLGGIFFGGLWWTVRKGLNAKQPGLWFLGSMIVRITIVMTGFYFVGGGQWERLLSCLIGFLAARSIVVWCTRLPHAKTLNRSAGVETCREPAVRFPEESHHAT